VKRTIIIFSIAGSLFSVSARADGIDLVPYFTRVAGDGHSFSYIATAMFCIMVANYALNFAVIGLPAIRFGSVVAAKAASGLVALTLFGQIADRVGALLAGVLVGPVTALFRLHGEGAWLVPLLILNFLFSGFTVVALAFYFLRRRWHIEGRLPWIVAIVAGLITNPAWIIGLWFIRGA